MTVLVKRSECEVHIAVAVSGRHTPVGTSGTFDNIDMGSKALYGQKMLVQEAAGESQKAALGSSTPIMRQEQLRNGHKHDQCTIDPLPSSYILPATSEFRLQSSVPPGGHYCAMKLSPLKLSILTRTVPVLRSPVEQKYGRREGPHEIARNTITPYNGTSPPSIHYTILSPLMRR